MYWVSNGLSCQPDILNSNSTAGAQRFSVFPGLITPPSGLVELATSITSVATHPLSPSAVNVKLKTPDVV